MSKYNFDFERCSGEFQNMECQYRDQCARYDAYKETIEERHEQAVFLNAGTCIESGHKMIVLMEKEVQNEKTR